MTYQETCLLLPCYSLEDFPMHHQGQEADGLLAAWTAVWHPALLAATERAPTWYHASSPPEEPGQRLILVPSVSLDQLPADYTDRVHQQGGRLVAGDHPRGEIFEQVLPPVASFADNLDPELVSDFLALGYAYLQVELLTRQMRYATNLDESHFFSLALAGAAAAAQGDGETAQDKLLACLDQLSQERDNYYAVDAYVLDVALLGPQTLGAPLRGLVDAGVPINLLLTGQLAQQLQQVDAATAGAVRAALGEGYVGLLGGDHAELPSPLLHCETLLDQLRAGTGAIERVLGTRPQVYGRRRFGMTPLLPQLLTRLGYLGVLHATLDAGRIPDGSQIKTRWEGCGQTAIDTISRTPLDAARAETFLGYAGKLGETMDMDHIATLCLAHWPGQDSPWYHDLRRIARHGALLGKFVTAEQYFRDSEYPTQLDHFRADQYQSPYLVQAIRHDRQDPISRYLRYWRARARLADARALATLAALTSSADEGTAAALDALAAEIDIGVDSADSVPADDSLDQAVQAAAQRLAAALPRGDAPAESGYLLLNPTSTVRRTPVETAQLERPPAAEKPVYASAADGAAGHSHAVVDVPPMGFVWLRSGPATAPRKKDKDLPLVDGHRLFNEFFEAQIDPATGALQGLYQYDVRGNRLSQQVAFRAGRGGARRGRDNRAGYSTMRARRVQTTAATPVKGEVTCEGQLVNRAGDVLAEYRQVYQVWRGVRVLRVRIELQPHAQPADEPWNSYYACRFAWASEAASLWRGVNQLRERAEAKRLEAPSYIEIDDGQHRTTVLTGGLPFHRRTGPRMLDSLLIVRGERQRQFELGIGVDVKYPVQESMGLLAPPVGVSQVAPPPRGSDSGWLFHVDSRNVVATSWSPVCERGQICGYRVRLLETLGRPARVRLRSFRPVTAATQLDLAGSPTGALELDAGSVQLRLEAHDWVEVEATWS